MNNNATTKTEESKNLILQVSNLGICYRNVRRMSLLHFSPFFKYDKSYQHWALRNVSFECEKGHILGVMGKNGAGKSTLCATLAGIYEPDEGEVVHHEHSASLLSLGKGISPWLSGRDNVYYLGALQGLKKDKITEIIPEIVEFSELREAFDDPVATYSSGMKSRLSFSVASSIIPEIMILDEVLSVGDIGFKEKCLKRIKQLMNKCKCVVLVSHSTITVNKFCDICLWLENGKVMDFGKTQRVTKEYNKFMKSKKA